MPDYSLQVNLADNYNPSHFTALREISKNMTDQYNNTMVAYGELSAKANMLEQLANDVQGTDSVAYQNYKNYADNLRRHTDLLASRGLNPSLSKNLMMASSDYSRIISPIEKAMEARTKEAERIATLKDKYPSLIAERDAGEIGIDQWMKLGNDYHAKTLDLETVANRARERFEALKSQIMQFVSENGGLDALMTKHPEAVKQWIKVNVPWLYESMYKTGANPEDVRRLLAGDPSMDDSLLKGIYNDTLRMYGTNTWNTDYDHYSKEQNTLRRLNLDNTMRGTIGGESVNAIGKTEFEKYEDKINSQILMERERLAEQRREFEAKLAAAKKAAGAESIDVDDAAASNPTLVKGDLDQKELLNIATQMKVLAEGEEGAFKNITPSQLADAIEKVKKAHNGVISLDDPNIIKEIQNAATIINSNDTHYWSGIWEGIKGIGSAWLNGVAKLNPIGLTVNAINSRGKGFGYFYKNLYGLTDEAFISSKDNFELANDYLTLSNAKSALKNIDKPVKSYGPTGTQYEYVMSEEEKSKEKAKLQATIDKLESKLGKNGKLGKAAYDANMAKLKEYGYTENMVKAGISPGFFANLMVNSNEINWNSFESSVLNDTSRKDLAQGFNAMITDRNNPDYVRLYKIGEKDLTDRVETTEWMGISGADPQNEKSGQTPVFSTNPKLGVLTVTYRDQRGKPVTYAVKKDDINRHPGFSEKLIQGIDEEHEIYELMSDPKKFFNMPEEKRDKYTKGLWKGLSEEERAKQMHNACAAFICAARPDITTVSDLNNAIKSLTSAEASVIILRLSMMAYLEGHNHDMMNFNVKNLLWGKNYNATTSARAQLFESWMSNN